MPITSFQKQCLQNSLVISDRQGMKHREPIRPGHLIVLLFENKSGIKKAALHSQHRTHFIKIWIRKPKYLDQTLRLMECAPSPFVPSELILPGNLEN